MDNTSKCSNCGRIYDHTVTSHCPQCKHYKKSSKQLGSVQIESKRMSEDESVSKRASD